jgi:hypothetical protein
VERKQSRKEGRRDNGEKIGDLQGGGGYKANTRKGRNDKKDRRKGGGVRR